MARIVLKCEDISIEGIGISTYNNLPIFIPDFLVGEEAEIQIVHKGYQKYFGYIHKIKYQSHKRLLAYTICRLCKEAFHYADTKTI